MECHFGPRSRALFYEGYITPEALRYSLWSVGERVRLDHGIFARIRIEREDRTVYLGEDGHESPNSFYFRPPDPAWYGWLFDLAREHGWEPTP